MPVIAVLNQKGGLAKLPSAPTLPPVLLSVGKKTLYVDADPQGSALDWNAARKQSPLFNVVGIPKNAIHRDIRPLAVSVYLDCH